MDAFIVLPFNKNKLGNYPNKNPRYYIFLMDIINWVSITIFFPLKVSCLDLPQGKKKKKKKKLSVILKLSFVVMQNGILFPDI